MDELTLLRRLDSSRSSEPDEDVLSAARAALLERARSATAPSSRPVRRRSGRPTRRVVVGGLGLVAAVCTVALVLDLGSTPRATADIAWALRVAASSAPEEQPAPGDVVTHQLMMVSIISDEVVDGVHPIDSGVLYRRTITLHRVSGTDEWTRTWSADTAVSAWGENGDARLREAREQPSESVPVESSLQSPNFWEQPHTLSPQQVAAMPRDPGALLQRLTGGTDDPESHLMPAPQRIIEAAADLLGSGLADPELQRTTYEALRAADGLTVDERAHDIDGRAGVQFSTLVSGGRQRLAIVMDSRTGRYLGLSETNLAGGALAPAGTLEEGTAVYTGE